MIISWRLDRRYSVAGAGVGGRAYLRTSVRLYDKGWKQTEKGHRCSNGARVLRCADFLDIRMLVLQIMRTDRRVYHEHRGARVPGGAGTQVVHVKVCCTMRPISIYELVLGFKTAQMGLCSMGQVKVGLVDDALWSGVQRGGEPACIIRWTYKRGGNVCVCWRILCLIADAVWCRMLGGVLEALVWMCTI